MSEEKNKFVEKLLKKLPEGFADNMESADTNEIKSKILEAEGNAYEIDKNKNSDEKLNGAKALVKDLSEPYRDAKNTEMAKIAYCLYVLENRGVKI